MKEVLRIVICIENCIQGFLKINENFNIVLIVHILAPWVHHALVPRVHHVLVQRVPHVVMVSHQLVIGDYSWLILTHHCLMVGHDRVSCVW